MRVQLEPGVEFGRQRHPGEGIVYLLDGALEYGVEGRPPATLRAGDVLFISAGAVQSAMHQPRSHR